MSAVALAGIDCELRAINDIERQIGQLDGDDDNLRWEKAYRVAALRDEGQTQQAIAAGWIDCQSGEPKSQTHVSLVLKVISLTSNQQAPPAIARCLQPDQQPVSVCELHRRRRVVFAARKPDGKDGSSGFGSAVFYFGADRDRFQDAFIQFGTVMFLPHRAGSRGGEVIPVPFHYRHGQREPFDPQHVKALLKRCILCGSETLLVAIFIPYTPEARDAVLRLRMNPVREGSDVALGYGLCAEHAIDPQAVAPEVENAIVAAAKRVTKQ